MEKNVRFVNQFCSKECLRWTNIHNIIDGMLQCHCGEDIEIYNWKWSRTHSSFGTLISNEHRDILFHPHYSPGTAIARGDIPFQPTFHYYWEIKMISHMYGTDVMVGIGTSKVAFTEFKFRYCSPLGIDSQSWGYSYHGIIQHDNSVQRYGSKFGLGSIIGVYLDMVNGTLEYYLNRKPLGTAFTNVKGHEIYPMVCSTVAQSAVRLVCSVSEEFTLQLLCLKFVSKNKCLHKRYEEIPCLKKFYDKKYFWIKPSFDEDHLKREADTESEKSEVF